VIGQIYQDIYLIYHARQEKGVSNIGNYSIVICLLVYFDPAPMTL